MKKDEETRVGYKTVSILLDELLTNKEAGIRHFGIVQYAGLVKQYVGYLENEKS